MEEKDESMKFFYKMEQKYRRYAIHNLMFYIIAMYVAGMFILQVSPEFYYNYLSLDARAILHGQVWRIVTFMIYPPVAYAPLMPSSLFSNLISLYLYYMLGVTLERVWGAFRFNMYFFMGILGHVLASIVVYLITGKVALLGTTYLNYSLFFAFAATFPDMEFLLFFVLPIKAKMLGIFNGLYFLAMFITGDLGTRIAIVMSLANFIIFFFMTRNVQRFNPKEMKRKRDFHKQMKMVPPGGTVHRCAVCGRTEKDDPGLEFRYCSKCEGNYEYCSEHLYTHKHVTREEAQSGNTN